MESRGVIYFNQNTKCVQRLSVSIFSLRKHYDGEVTVLLRGPQTPAFLKVLKELNCSTLEIPDSNDATLAAKASLWRYTPYDLTMFIDADTIVVGPIDEYFDKIKEYTFCTGGFAEWRSTGGIMSKRIKAFSPLVPDYVEDALAYGKATNTGIFGFTRDAAILEEWESLARAASSLCKIPDEIACQMLLPRYKHWLAPVKWGVSVNMSNPEHYADMRIVHYHGRKHVSDWELCAIWKQHFWEMVHEYPQHAEFLQHHRLGDRRLRRYLNEVKATPFTVVTAVNPKYLAKLRDNYPKWMKTEGVMEKPMLLFIHDIPPNDPSLSFLRKNVIKIPWDMDKYDSMRELMLTSFVLGTAAHVKTDWWMKLDADTTPKEKDDYVFGYKLDVPEGTFDSPYNITGHKCGYTKPGEFLTRLEDWADAKDEFKGTKRVFPLDQVDTMNKVKRYGHIRIASFICFQSLAFTKECAQLAGDKLPVPSHDTYMWYVAARKGYNAIRHNFKRNFQP